MIVTLSENFRGLFMCGISGYLSVKNMANQLDESILAIKHRGPDSNGVKNLITPSGKHLGFGHVRLSILDLSNNGHQPMISACNDILMIFNGEIYNYIALKAKLDISKLTGSSDSEVLLEYYSKFGIEGFANLRGMFAVAFYHISSGKLIVARDSMGIKPVYYKNDSSGFYFSSEVKGINSFLNEKMQVCKNSLFEFLNCGFVYEPNTGYEGVFKVPAGGYLEITDESFAVYNFFNIDYETKNKKFNKNMVSDGISSQLASDVKMGMFFSGGLDSSVIAAITRLDGVFASYSKDEIQETGSVDDSPYALEIADQLNIKLIEDDFFDNTNSPASIINSMKTVALNSEELMCDFTFFASLKLSKIAKNHGYKVMLSGMGGDEAFVGYPRYLLLTQKKYKYIYQLLKVPLVFSIVKKISFLKKKADRFVSFYKEKKFVLAYSRLLGYLDKNEIQSLWIGSDFSHRQNAFVSRMNKLLVGFEGDSDLIKALILDYSGFLSHNLSVADKSSMMESLELRVPLLDQDSYCSYISSLRAGTEKVVFGKQALKNILLNYLPKRLVERKKSGFNPPLDTKINALGLALIKSELKKSKLSSYIQINTVLNIVDEHFLNKRNNTYKIWQFLYLAYWLEG